MKLLVPAQRQRQPPHSLARVLSLSDPPRTPAAALQGSSPGATPSLPRPHPNTSILYHRLILHFFPTLVVTRLRFPPRRRRRRPPPSTSGLGIAGTCSASAAGLSTAGSCSESKMLARWCAAGHWHQRQDSDDGSIPRAVGATDRLRQARVAAASNQPAHARRGVAAGEDCWRACAVPPAEPSSRAAVGPAPGRRRQARPLV